MDQQGTIYDYVVKKTNHVSDKDLVMGKALSIMDISKNLDISRLSISKDLNELVKQNKLSKISGRPVRYSRFINELSNDKNSGTNNVSEETDSNNICKELVQNNVFDQVVGNEGSMQTAISQARSAIIYPPNGLNALIVGPTGSGKTYFARLMFEFSVSQNLLKNNQELVTFNCADYSHNPELLMSHLFGYKKGSFTGANDEQDGLLKLADGGMLFLDEIHRLPPEGQEMIFYFMDHGTYSKLGETRKSNKASVRIICATTEDPNSTLLSTFIRRIPVKINMPEFQERSLDEQLEILVQLLKAESNQINKKISISRDAIKYVLESVTYGNIGQLKSNLQALCAQAFLRSVEKQTDTIILEPDFKLSESSESKSGHKGLNKLVGKSGISVNPDEYLSE